jgi:hypothetical protein
MAFTVIKVYGFTVTLLRILFGTAMQLISLSQLLQKNICLYQSKVDNPNNLI